MIYLHLYTLICLLFVISITYQDSIHSALPTHAPVFHSRQVHNLNSVLGLPIIPEEFLARVYFGNLAVYRQGDFFSGLQPVDDGWHLEQHKACGCLQVLPERIQARSLQMVLRLDLQNGGGALLLLLIDQRQDNSVGDVRQG